MPFLELGSNLNTLGNNGAFESAASGWGFSLAPIGFDITRSSTYKNAGTYSARCQVNSTSNNTYNELFPVSFAATAGKKYVIKAKILGLSGSPIASDPDYSIGVVNLPDFGDYTPEANTPLTIADLSANSGNFTDFEFRVTCDATKTFSGFALVVLPNGNPNQMVIGNSIYIDTVKVYEYVEYTSMGISNTKTNVTCYGAQNGTINVTLTGGQAPFTYLWSDGGATKNRTNLAPGTYSLTVTDFYGEQIELNDITITQPTQIILQNSNQGNVSCFGDNSGFINITISGGTGGYSYQWLDGSTSRNRSNLYAGNYKVTVVDSSGCSRNFNFTITQPDQIQITANVTGNDVTVDVTGGVAPYSYSWDDGVTTKDRTDLENGIHTLTVIDANGCIRSANVLINDFKFYFSENPINLQLVAASPETKENLSFLADAYIENDYKSDTFIKIYEAEHPAKTDGSTFFDFREILNAFLEPLLPEFGSNAIELETGSFKRFYLAHSEKYGDPPVAAGFTQIDTFFVLLGGLSEQEHAKQTFFDSFLEDEMPFFTWQPVEKEVLPTQHEYLSFPVISELVTSLKLKARISYDDDTQTEVEIATQNTVEPFEIYRFPAGYTQNDLTSFNPAKTIEKYTLWIVDQADNVISQERIYKVIESEEHHRTFLYLNSLGRWDTLLAKGRSLNLLKTTSQVIDRELPVDYKYSNREAVVTGKSGQFENTISIGNLTNEEKAHLVDFAISTQVYEITNSGYLPVQIIMELNAMDDFTEMIDITFVSRPPITRKFTPEL